MAMSITWRRVGNDTRRHALVRKAKDQPNEPLAIYSFTIRLTDIGVLNRVGDGNLSLGLRRLIDLAYQQQLPGTLHPDLVLDEDRSACSPPHTVR